MGAFDPTELSNTRHFYDRGWSGIDIEPIPERAARFRELRPRDVTLNVGVAGTRGTLTFYEMDPPTLSTFSREEAERCAAFPGHRIARTHEIPVLPLRDILEEHARGKTIEFLSIDTEGLEDDVIRSHDWERVRPVALLIEYRVYHPQGMEGSSPRTWEPYLLERGYRFACANEVNALYVRAEDEALLARIPTAR